MIRTLTQHETVHIIQGPAGQLEVVMAKPTARERAAWGIVCHPHSLYGGSMQNKVVTTLVKTFQHLGVNTARFNFRGVGRSEGEFDHGEGELYDLLAVVEWLLKEHPDREIWLAGFSFGAYVALKAATQIPLAKLVVVAPPVEHFPVKKLPPLLCPWILVQGELDDVVLPEAVFVWAKKRKPKPHIIRFPTAGHFFHGQLGELRVTLEKALQK